MTSSLTLQWAERLSFLVVTCSNREKRSAERRLKAAKFPTIKSLDAFDFAARPSVNKVLIAELARCEFIDKRENLPMVGNLGPGRVIWLTALT